MKMFGFSVVVFPDGKSYTSWCPELDVASQGESMDEAVANLKEALELHIESLSPMELKEIKKRGTRFLTTVEIPLPV